MRGCELPSSKISLKKKVKMVNKMKGHFWDKTNLSVSVNFKERDII